MRAWLNRLHPWTSLNYSLFDLALGFGTVDVLLYVLAPASPATRAVLGDGLYLFIGPPTWGVLLLAASAYALVVSGLPHVWLRTGFLVLLPAIAGWVGVLVMSVVISGAAWADLSKIIALAVLMMMLVVNALRWMSASRERDGSR